MDCSNRCFHGSCLKFPCYRRRLLVLGCLNLLARIGFAGYAIAKLIMGATYRPGFAAQEMIPAFAITSGCFQFLMFAFKSGPSEGSQSEDEDDARETFRQKFRLIIRCLAAILNTGILVTGTVGIVVELNFTNQTFPCQHSVMRMMNTTIPTPTAADSTNLNPVHTTTEQNRNRSTLPMEVNKATIRGDINTTGLIFTDTSDSFDDTGETSTQVLCLDALLTFVTVAVCVDWFVAISGTALLCFLWCRSNRAKRRQSDSKPRQRRVCMNGSHTSPVVRERRRPYFRKSSIDIRKPLLPSEQ